MPRAPEKIIREPEFARRLSSASDNNPNVPALHFGRLVWVKAQLKSRFDIDVSKETVRKWYWGEAKPRDEKLRAIAQILEVDEAWLSLGIAPDLAPREQKKRVAEASGAVLLLAGLIQMAGGHPAFPDEDDDAAARDHIDLYAIIRGAQYRFHVTLAQQLENGDLRFNVPSNHEGAFQVGVIPEGEFGVRLVELQPEIILLGNRRGAVVEVVLSEMQAEAVQIRSLRNRL